MLLFLILNDVSVVEEYFHSIVGITAEYCLVKWSGCSKSQPQANIQTPLWPEERVKSD